MIRVNRLQFISSYKRKIVSYLYYVFFLSSDFITVWSKLKFITYVVNFYIDTNLVFKLLVIYNLSQVGMILYFIIL